MYAVVRGHSRTDLTEPDSLATSAHDLQIQGPGAKVCMPPSGFQEIGLVRKSIKDLQSKENSD